MFWNDLFKEIVGKKHKSISSSNNDYLIQRSTQIPMQL